MSSRSAEPIDRCVVWTAHTQLASEELLGVLERRGFRVAGAHSAHEAVGEVCALSREGLAAHDRHGEHDAHGEPDAPDEATPRTHIVVLILSDPANLEHLAQAHLAISTYCPRAVCWWFDAASRRLRAADVSDITRWANGPAVVVKSDVARATPSVTRAGPPKGAASGGVPRPPVSRPASAAEADDVTDAFLGIAPGRPSLRLAGEGTLPPRPEESENALAGDVAGSQGGMGGILTGEELAMLLDPDPPGRAFRKE